MNTYQNAIKNFYNKLADRFNIDYKSGDHISEEIQLRKYFALADVGPMDYASILDVGCGTGLFYDFLTQNHSGFKYTGIDISDRAVRVADENHDNVDFRVIDILREDPGETAEYIIADGLFDLKLEGYTDDYRNRMINRLWMLAEKAAAINFNSIFSGNRDEQDRQYFNPGDILNYCLSICPNAVLRHDYLPDYFTVYLYRS